MKYIVVTGLKHGRCKRGITVITMGDPHISFYLKAHRIHIYIDTLRAIGCPERVCFMINNEGDQLILSPYTKRDLLSHRVPRGVYHGTDEFEVSSYRLCEIISTLHNWDSQKSYKVLGNIIHKYKIVRFDLRNAIEIGSDPKFKP